MVKSPFRTITPNGTEILIEPMPHVKSCSVGFWVKLGSCGEANGEEGLGHFVEHAVFKGTEHYRKAQLIAEATDRLGGNVDAFTGKETTCFYGKVLKEQLPNLVHLLGDLITTPRFEVDELNRERKVILEEISQSEDQPDDWVNELFYANFWPNGALEHSILGTREMITNYEVTQIKDFFTKTYQASSILIAAAGDVQVDSFLDMLNPILSKIPCGTNKSSMRPNKPKSFLLNAYRNELQQANLIIGFPSYHHRHPNLMAANLLSYILGGSMSSRLFMELREKNALCYQIGSYANQYFDTGVMQIVASCAPSCAKELVKKAIAVCYEFRQKHITSDELERAKFQFKTNLLFSQESTSNRMFTIANQAIHIGRLYNLEEQIQIINSVNLDQIQKVALEILVPDHLGISILGTNDATNVTHQDLS